jgi:hypothetical protein
MLRSGGETLLEDGRLSGCRMREERQQYGVNVVLRNKRRFLQRRLGIGQFLAFLIWVSVPKENAVAPEG